MKEASKMKKKIQIEILLETPHTQVLLEELAEILKKGVLGIVKKTITGEPTVTIKITKIRPTRSAKENVKVNKAAEG